MRKDEETKASWELCAWPEPAGDEAACFAHGRRATAALPPPESDHDDDDDDDGERVELANQASHSSLIYLFF